MKKPLFLKVVSGVVLTVAILALGTTALAQINPLTATIVTPLAGADFTVGQAITFSATASGGVAPYVFLWDFNSDGQTDAFGTSFNKTDGFATVGSKTITLTVGDAAASPATVTRTVAIDITSASPALAISNVQITNVTSSGATITWTTNKDATSRVIYDTVSHSDITGATAPNFGYANSTATTDDTTKVTAHSVVITSLSASTQYFFRVISES